LLAGNAVADDVVDRGADRLRKAAVIERRRDRAVIDDEVVAEPVELAGRDAGPDVGRDEVERLRGQPARPAHAVEALLAVNLDGPPFRDGLVDVHLVHRLDSLGSEAPAVAFKWEGSDAPASLGGTYHPGVSGFKGFAAGPGEWTESALNRRTARRACRCRLARRRSARVRPRRGPRTCAAPFRYPRR